MTEKIQTGLKGFLVPPPMRLSQWADTHFYLSAESSGTEGRWKCLPYQVGILDTMGNDDVKIVDWMKSARVGYTKCFLIAIAFNVTHRKRNILIYQPTDTDAADFVKDEIDPIIRDVAAVRDALKSDPGKKSPSNTLSRKEFLGAILDIKGGKTARNYRRMTKDGVSYDELDGFDHDIDKEGSPLILGDKRLEASPFPKSIRGSTPGVKGASLIEPSFLSADVKLYRFLPCPKCGTYQDLVWSNVRFRDKDPKTAHYLCDSCKYEIDYSDYADMDAKGVWRTKDGTVYLDSDSRFRNGQHEPIDAPEHVGFHIWGAYSYFRPWHQMVKQFLKAKESLTVDHNNTELKTFVNTVLAETWEEDPGEQLEWETLMARAEQYPIGTIPDGGLLLVAGVDTQDDRLALVIVAYGAGEESWRVYHTELAGDPVNGDVFEELDHHLRRPYLHESGIEMHVRACAIDTRGHRTQAVYNYVRTRVGSDKVERMACASMTTPGNPVVGRANPKDVTWGGKTFQEGIKLWQVGADTAKTQVYAHMRLKEPGPGYFHTPIGMSESYYMQATAEKRVPRYKKGFQFDEWVKTRRNEVTDCEMLCYVAAIRMGLHRIQWAKERERLIQRGNTAKVDEYVASKLLREPREQAKRTVFKSKNPYL